MADWREQKRRALGDIHRTFQIPAVYLTHAAGTPVRVNVRLHKRPVVAESPFDGDGPTYHDIVDRIVFDVAELAAVHQRAYVIFGNSEAYLTGPSKPEREGFVHVEVSEVTQADLIALLNAIDTDHAAFEGIL